ncbi:hypothetical protein GQX74_014440 [Glossina fuscipes]|nr:hypothetical protein GQX74_014440 [Glossina fuscipes]
MSLITAPNCYDFLGTDHGAYTLWFNEGCFACKFKDARLSVMQHDPDTFALKSLSLHVFEGEDIKDGRTGRYYVPMVRVDPDARCAVMVQQIFPINMIEYTSDYKRGSKSRAALISSIFKISSIIPGSGVLQVVLRISCVLLGNIWKFLPSLFSQFFGAYSAIHCRNKVAK